MNLEKLGYLSVGSQMRRIYEKLQLEADSLYGAIDVEFKSSWFPIYYTLMKSNRALSVTELSESISYSRITVKNVIREMEKLKYLEIHPNPLDSRSKLIALTDKGQKTSEKLAKVWMVIQGELENLFGSENDSFLQQLSSINRQLTETSFKKVVLGKYYDYTIRKAKQDEYDVIGDLLVNVYSNLKGFPKVKDQPKYYELLQNVGELTKTTGVELLVAVGNDGSVGGSVVYFNDMKDYGSGGTAIEEKNACGFRLLAVSPKFRGLGLGKLLTCACIEKGKNNKKEVIVIHTTQSMKLAWKMYERLNFKRAQDLDFMQERLPVFGFRLNIK